MNIWIDAQETSCTHSPKTPPPSPSPQAGRGEFDLRQRRGGVLFLIYARSLGKWLRKNIYTLRQTQNLAIASLRDAPRTFLSTRRVARTQ